MKWHAIHFFSIPSARARGGALKLSLSLPLSLASFGDDDVKTIRIWSYENLVDVYSMISRSTFKFWTKSYIPREREKVPITRQRALVMMRNKLEFVLLRYLVIDIIRLNQARADANSEMKRSVCVVLSLSLVFFFCISFPFFSLSLVSFRGAARVRFCIRNAGDDYQQMQLSECVKAKKKKKKNRNLSLWASENRTDARARARKRERERERERPEFFFFFDLWS